MPLGLPAHLVLQARGRSFARAQHVTALTCLVMAGLAALVFQNASPDAVLWPAALAVVPAIIVLWFWGGSRRAGVSTLYLAVGGVGLFAYASAFLSQPVPIQTGDGFTFLAIKVALVLVGGGGFRLAAGVGWTVAGYLVAETAHALALIQSGNPWRLDLGTLTALAVTLAVLPLVIFIGPRLRRAQPLLYRAERDEHVAAVRYRLEVRAAALMHDTILGHLAAVAGASEGRLNPRLRSQIESDLESLVGEEWLTEPSTVVSQKTRIDWQQSGLFLAIQDGRLLGLDVVATGDLSAVGRLDRDRSISLGLAVKQCLVNVLKHSGQHRAEVAVYGSPAEVSVMVVDMGRGFEVSSTGDDRLGLRTSVRRRIQEVGGTVQVWSTPGRGTSIMIRVPVAKAQSQPDSAKVSTA